MKFIIPVITVSFFLLAVIVAPAGAIMAGDETGTPADSPSNRIIANSDTGSPFAGVGTIDGLPVGRGTATPLSRWHILTAAHIADPNGDTIADADPETFSFNLNYGSDYSSVHTGLDIAVQPNWTGFGSPSVNDDLAIVTLSTPIPEDVPIYSLYTSTLNVGNTLDFVGYGQSGYGDVGYSTGASWTVKRWGRNKIGARVYDDDGSAGYEVWRADFDGPTGNGYYSGTTLGNDVETSFGMGDSGGPAFYYTGGEYYVAGINTFVFDTSYGDAPEFGSGLGGILIQPYVSWINDVLDQPIILPGDVNGDEFVGGDDLNIILENWGLTGATRQQGDLTGEGFVGGADYKEVLTYWGNGIPPESPEPNGQLADVPEPLSISLLATGLAVLLRRRA